MIPQRIKLSGFLSYRDEQEIGFDGSQLWMLSGMNGSGKSTVFDAVTYALFGHHRGGQQQSVELINKDSKTLSVEFDFRIDRDLFRIKRTLKRTPKGAASGTQQISAWQRASSGEGGDWEPVADTGRRTEFDNWVREHIGLTYETFTSSVLLLQGKAEKLLDSKPSGRAEVLAGIVDLERYQKLHEKADNRRRSLKAQLEALQNQFDGVPDVSDMELLAAQGKVDEAHEAHQAAVAEVERLQALEYEAKQWAELQKRLAGLKERQAQAEALLGDAAAIEKDYRRLRELQEVLPHILTVQERDRDVEESRGRTARLEGERDAAGQRRASAQHALGLARQKRSALQKTIANDEQRLRTVGVSLREMSGQIEKVKLLEAQQAQLKQTEAELGRLPPDPEADVRTLQSAHDERVEQGQALPPLERFQQNRAALSVARQKLDAAERRTEEIRKTGEQARDLSRALRERADAAAKARAEADERATRARARADQAAAELEEIHSLEGKKTCGHCGQELTAAHVAEERTRRDSAARAAERQFNDAAAAQKKAREEDRAASEAAAKAEQEYRQLQEDYRQSVRDVNDARRDGERASQECQHAYLSLPPSYHQRIAPNLLEDWLKTEYPSRGDLSQLRKAAGEAEGVRTQLQAAHRQLTKWTALRGQFDSIKHTLARLTSDLPEGNPEKLRAEFASLQSEEESLTASLRGTKKSLQDTESEVERLGQELVAAGNELTDLAGKLNVEDEARRHHRDAIEKARAALPAPWRERAAKAGLSEQLGWKVERDELVSKGAEERFHRLATARAGLDGLAQEVGQLQQEEAQFPMEARETPEQIRTRCQAVRQQAAERDRVLKEAQKERAVLDDHRQKRQRLRAQTLELEREHNYGSLLAQLLGRDRLQRHLVRVAERQIVDYANAVLDRLSGGQLFLRLCGGEEGAGTERALELEACNRTTGGSAINVAFLSGSQRFRVAVSLALGIGQYASRQHRPIESVIIDEGFGCLDRQGRQVMIQELQNLRGHLHCILLVSHQEEFADAFPDGYRFELQEGATKVTRLQK